MRHLLLSLLCFVVLNCVAQQKKYLPKDVHDLYLGMSKDSMMKLRPNASVPENSEYGYPVETFEGGDIKQIIYETDESESVYEFIIEYRDKDKAIALAKKMYKVPNDPEPGFELQWKFKLKDGSTLSSWIYESKICIKIAPRISQNEK